MLNSKVCRRVTWIAVACFATQISQAVTLIEETDVATKTVAAAVPEPRSFSIATAGTYAISLVDIGADPNAPAGIRPAISPKLVVVQGMSVVGRLDAPGTGNIALSPGNYVLRIAGKPQSGSAAQLNALIAQGGTTVVAHSVGIMPDVSDNPLLSTVEKDFVIASAGTYTVESIDRVFPASLASLRLTVVSPDNVPVMCLPANAVACPGVSGNSFTANPGTYTLFAIAEANATQAAGLYSVRISGAFGSGVVYADTHPVGRMPASESVQLSTTASYGLSANDLAFPAALAELHVALTQGANAAVLNAVGTATLVATAGEARLYAVVKPNSTAGAGNYGVQVRRGAEVILSAVKAANAAQTTTHTGLTFRVELPSAGTYQVQVRDFRFPQELSSVRTAVTQSGSILASADNASTLSIDAAAGPIDILIVAAPASAANGLLGIEVAQDAAKPLWRTSQAVGGLFKSRTISLPAATRYELSFADLQFPAAFSDLAVAITRGTTLIGQAYAAGGSAPAQLRFDATLGDYTFNFIAQPAANQDYGVYGIKLEDLTAAPTVSLTASPTSVSQGGRASLTWSSTDASMCTASGGWTGAKATSGVENNIGPLNADTTFTLTCTGSGGTQSRSASVTMTSNTAAGKNTGGGSLTSELWLLIIVAAARMIRRTSESSSSSCSRAAFSYNAARAACKS